MPKNRQKKEESPFKSVLQTDRLTKRFGNTIAVRDLTLDVREGEVFGLLGPNGAGKTTAISMMYGLLKPDRGKVFIHGKPLGGLGFDARLRVGVCPQNIVLWGTLTCIEQLKFIGEMYGIPGKKAHRRGIELLEIMGLAEKGNSQAKTLSGGMQRRLNLIMALVHDPDIVILDEPEAGLDPQSRVLVREYIRSLARNKTVVLTTHNMDEADRMADRVAIIDHGSLLTLDTPEALKSRIGKGDVLEVEIAGDATAAVERAVRSIRTIAWDAEAAGNVLIVRSGGRDSVKTLLRVLEKLRDTGVTTGDVRLRQNTLEDVFISLTGRRLRE